MAKKIIVVDDDKVTRSLLEKTLILQGYWVYSAKDGEEGFALIKKEKPDAVIVDILIPNIDGMELCRKVRETSGLSKTKVILITAVYKSPAFQNEAKKCGANWLTTKPLDTKEVLRKLENLMKES